MKTTLLFLLAVLLLSELVIGQSTGQISFTNSGGISADNYLVGPFYIEVTDGDKNLSGVALDTLSLYLSSSTEKCRGEGCINRERSK